MCNLDAEWVIEHIEAIETRLDNLREMLEDIIDALGELRETDEDKYIQAISEAYANLDRLRRTWSMIDPPEDGEDGLLA